MTTDEFYSGDPDRIISDLVDEMIWEDLTNFLTLEEAGLENGFIADSVPAAQKLYYKEEGER